MTFRPFRIILSAFLALLVLVPLAARAQPPVEAGVQAFLDAQPGLLKSFKEDQHSAAELIQTTSAYYGVSPRIVLALLEATSGLLSTTAPPDQALRQPISTARPGGFANQLDWATRELRAGLGPYDRPPVVRFTDGTTLTLSLQQAPEGIAIQRLLAKDRTQGEWRAAFDRFTQAFQQYFNNELPEQQQPKPAATSGFLQRPWAPGTRVVHLAYFDHMFPTVDTDKPDNGYVVNYLGHGSVQYDGHDAHDFYFPDQPIGTYIYAAADGIARASTHRGNGVWIEHANGYVTVYWHLDKFSKKFRGKVNTGEGVRVHAGDLIGSSGKSGFVVGTPHLHFEVRHNGKQVDPYGWYGPGADPCIAYAACEASVWLWSHELAGEFDFTPPNAAAPPDQAPPVATLSINPPDDLLLLAHFDGSSLPQLGMGNPTVEDSPNFVEARFGSGALVSGGDRLAFPTAGNLDLDAGTIAFWARLPERYPETPNGRQYLLATSAYGDEGPVYTGTLALRRDMLGPNNSPQWTFWTTPDAGASGRNDLSTPDTLGPGLHHFAITWDRARQSKALYLDGRRAIGIIGVDLPHEVGAMLDLGRWAPGVNAGGVAFDELAIYNRALGPFEVAELAARDTPLQASATSVDSPDLAVVAKAIDDGGAIVGLQLGVDGQFGDPQPYDDRSDLRLPAQLGEHTIAARLFDRAGNSTTISTTVTLAPPPLPRISLGDITDRGAMLDITQVNDQIRLEGQISASPTFADAAWQALPLRAPVRWPATGPRLAWVRFRDPAGMISKPAPVGPDARTTWLPLMQH